MIETPQTFLAMYLIYKHILKKAINDTSNSPHFIKLEGHQVATLYTANLLYKISYNKL